MWNTGFLVSALLPALIIMMFIGSFSDLVSCNESCTLQQYSYSKNPYPYGNCTFPNEIHHQGQASMRPQPSACQVLMIHWVGKCAISTQAWVLAFYPMTCNMEITHFHIRFPALIVSWWFIITFTLQWLNSVTETYKTAISQCWYTLILQRVALPTGNVFRKLKHHSITIGCWDIQWRVTLLFHVRTSVDISNNQSACHG